MKTRFIVTTLGISALLSALAVGLSNLSDSDELPPNPHSSSAARSQHPDSPVQQLGFMPHKVDVDVGDVLIYALRSELELSIDDASGERPTMSSLEWRATWQWVVVERGEENFTVVASMSANTLTNRIDPQNPMEIPAAGLAAPTRAVLGHNGEVLSVAFSPQSSVHEMQLLRSLWASVSADLGLKEAVAWTSDLSDGQGRFTARFARGDNDELSKIKVRYTGTLEAKQPEVESSLYRFEFTSGQRVRELKCNEELLAPKQTMLPATRSRFEVQLSLQGDLAQAQTPAEQRRALLALVGVGSPLVLEPVGSLLGSEDDSVRRLCAEIFASVDVPSAAQALARLALADRDAEVRTAAVEGLARHPSAPEWQTIFARVARQDVAPTARAGAVRALLSPDYVGIADSREVLAWVSANDSHDGVRKLASRSA